jgi:tetratricopeptide (TPR) repeat protein
LLASIVVPLASTTRVFSVSEAVAADATSDSAAKDQRRVLKAKDVSTESMSEEYRNMARQKRRESMRFLKDLLAQGTAQGEQKAEMMLRLADLYFEEGRDIYLTEMADYEKKYDVCYNDKTCDPAQMKADNTGSRDWQGKSIKLYRQILTSYPQYQRADEATFYLATALLDTGQADEAVKEFTRLVRTYPQSQWVPDSYVMIGEYYFDNNNAYKALVAYQKASAYKDSDKYAFSLYKLAWCYYNVGEYGKAIDTMKTVVANAMATTGGDATTRKKKIQLEEEALKDLVRFFADAGEMDEAYVYFNKLGKKDLIRSMLKRLAQTYFEQGKFEQCIQTYRRLISEDPQSLDAPEYQNEIIQAYQKIGKKDDTLSEIDRLLKNYGKNSAWSRTNAANQDALNKAREFIEKNLRTVATNYHNEAKKLGSSKAAKDTYGLAYRAYTVYLSEFPDSQYSYDVRYAFSELLYKIKKFDEAYEQYMKVVATDPKGSHSEFCAESAIFAADEMVKKTGGASGAGAGGSTEPVKLEDWEQKLLAALDQYAKLFPGTSKVKNVIYKSAYLLYNKNHFKEASDRFRVVIGMDPASKEAEQAANLILDSFTLVQDWENLKDVSKAFYDQQGLGSATFKKETYNIYERASFKLIEEKFKKNNDKSYAAKAYEGFYQEFPQSTVADVALNNASVYYFDLGRLPEAMTVRHMLIEKFPKSKFFQDQVAALGFDYESIADFENAAFWYEKLFSVNKEHTGTADAIYSAALFREALGDWQGAIKNLQQYITAFPTKENVNDVTLMIGKIYEDNEKWAEASKVYQTFYKRTDLSKVPVEQVYYARLRYGLDLKKMGQDATVDKHWKETLGEFEKARAKGVNMGGTVEFIAQMMYYVSEDQYKTYEALQISGPPNKATPRKQTDKVIADQLIGKAKSLQKTEATYAQIINTGAGEWGIASLVRLGQAYENMGETLKHSYIPSYLTADQRELYQMALEDKIYPQIDKAVDAYKRALDKSFELSVYNETTAFATRRLGALRPEDFPGLEENILSPAYTSVRAYANEYAIKP